MGRTGAEGAIVTKYCWSRFQTYIIFHDIFYFIIHSSSVFTSSLYLLSVILRHQCITEHKYE
jgi:hypothetical protein